MATSAVGPGFLTQTTVFTQSLGASFGFVILTSILIDIAVQLNIWRVIAVSELRAPDIANRVLPGLGGFISLLILLGGLAFNIGNVGGAGLGLEVLTGLPVAWCAVLAAALALAVFLVREAGPLMDRFAQLMGLVMILAIIYVAVVTQPPVAEAALRTVVPATIDYRAIITLVGGTVGGYITFSGGHRLLDAGIKGPTALPEVSRSAIMGVSVASLIRVLLFLATLGVVARGLAIDEGNPTASVFQLAAGSVGYKLFGVVMFAAAITSIIGSAYTSISFLKSMLPAVATHENRWIIGFILFSTLVFVWVGKPVSVLVWAGALNGFILPITLGTLLVAAYRPSVIGSYRHPLALTVFGVLVVLLMTWMSGAVLVEQVMGPGK
ncbi:divalent metal cation transporter [Hymenobacter sp. HSC-4F20]|nr:divalent metal cation transporter [Hymenobacter sp. HSC-4F20]